jgi:signal transduction histidine kinase/CheY-like chemotaxis protein
MNDSIERSVTHEQVNTLFKSIGALAIINLTVGAALTSLFWKVVPHSLLLSWMGAIVVMIAIRIAMYRSYSRHFQPNKLERYQNFLVWGSLSAGIIWGAGGVLMLSQGPIQYQLLIVASMLAMAGGSAFSLSIYLPAFYAFVPVALLPMVVRLFTMGGGIQTGLGVVTLVFLIALTLFNIRINKSLKKSMSLQFENLDLVDELQRKKEEADRANLGKSRFLAAASHDLRQPLYALALYTAAIENREFDAETKHLTGQVSKSVAAIKTLLDTLLDISILDTGAVEVNKQSIALNHLFTKLGHEFTPQANEKGLSLRWPKNAGIIYSDSNLIEQILRNYLSNAVRNTEQGTISLSCIDSGELITIQVTDTGKGIPASECDLIFDEFHQLDNPERDREKGLGLGLSIVQRTAKVLGHSISVKSELDEGSTFSIEVEKSTAPLVSSISNEEVERTPGTFDDMFVVVIDDDIAIRDGLQKLLSGWGCEVLAAAGSDEATTLLKDAERPPSVIIADYRLRENKKGIDAIKSVQAMYTQDIPSIIVTGDTNRDVLKTIQAHGFQVLHKPVPPAKLRAFLRNAHR